MDQAIRVNVPVHVAGVPRGVREQGGMIDFVTREVEVECLPGDIPATFEVDVTDLVIGDHLEVGALQLPAGVTLLEELDRVILSVTYPQRAEEQEEEAEELLEAEREEPEVIRRGKEEAEEGEGAED
jgi:large subunit ribosomal protein L25